jgi:large conductance mechanosensitive channel
MLKGFKEFILRGNVIDLAVAVVIGAAFSSVVTAFTDKIIKPLLNAITPPTTAGFGPTLVPAKPTTLIDFGALISAAINFLLVAVVVYFAIVLPMRSIQERRKRGMEPAPAEPTDVELLTEIRDLLKAQANGQLTGRADQLSHTTSVPATPRFPADPTASGGSQARDAREPELFTQPGRTTPLESTTAALGTVPPIGGQRAGGVSGAAGASVGGAEPPQAGDVPRVDGFPRGGGVPESSSGTGARDPLGAPDSGFRPTAPGSPGRQGGSPWAPEAPGTSSGIPEAPESASPDGASGARTVGKFSIGSVGERRRDGVSEESASQTGTTGAGGRPGAAAGNGPSHPDGHYWTGDQWGGHDQSGSSDGH